MTVNVLIAPSGFKESLSPEEVADCIEEGILKAQPDAKTYKVPLVDGGEGFTKALIRITGGTLHAVNVTGPVGQEVEAHFGFLGGEGPRTAVLEISSAAGLRLIPANARDPLKTTTYGVGELIKATLDHGARRLLIGCGDSGTNDGGAGMAQALGVHLLDAQGSEIGRGGAELRRLRHIDMLSRDPRINHVDIDVACNWQNVLCGPNGVARIFGPQKGASPQAVAELEAGLNQFADVIEREMAVKMRNMPGSGASGGLGAGLYAFLKAALHPCYDIVMQYLDVDFPLRQADIVITAEGCVDSQTRRGKIPVEIARRAKSRNLPVVVLAGTIGQGAEENFAYGIDSYSSILEAPISISEAMLTASELLIRAAERAMRFIQVGQRVERSLFESDLTIPLQSPVQATEGSLAPSNSDRGNSLEPSYLSMLLRELRAPLAVIMGYTEMVQNGKLGKISFEQDRALRNVMRQSNWLLAIMNALFNSLDPQSEITKSNQSERAYEDDWARKEFMG